MVRASARGESGKRGYRMKIRKFPLFLGFLRDSGGHRLPAERAQGCQPPLRHSRSGQFRGRLNQRDPMDSGRSGSVRDAILPFACQMAGSNYDNFGKTGGKGLNRLE